MAGPLRIAVIGTGFAAHFHLASYRKVYGESFEIAAVCGRNGAAAAALAGEYGIARIEREWQAVLADPGVDAVDFCVPNDLHVPLILAAARAGKHIICEKPLGGYFGPADADADWSAEGFPRQAMLDAVAAQARQVREAVAQAGITFCYGENWVHAPAIAKLDRLMSASNSAILRIEGEESHSGSHAGYSRRWRTAGGGSLLRLGVHPIAAALWLKQQEGRRRDGVPIRPARVSATTARLTGTAGFRAQQPRHVVDEWIDVEDFATVTIMFEDSTVAQLTSTDTRLGGIRNFLTAHGSRAQVTANINPNTACQAYTPDGRYFADEYLVEKTETKEGWSFPAPDEDMITGYPEELRDFVGAIANGRPPKSDLMLACDTLVLVYAAYLSAED
ncbi:MAG: Gfo/Idh/MocA family oxidoreductase, partial [Novosphingobium sp.]|nr:Gfo/Idh/MocA family oxidoreductase [Novosphingobium sp.]